MAKHSEGEKRADDPTLPDGKSPTHVRGLDDVLNGGVPASSLTAVRGGPGTGKTMLGLETAVRNAENGSPAVFLTFEEKEQALTTYGRALGWNIDALRGDGMLQILSARVSPDALLSGDFDLQGVLAILDQLIDRIDARLVVLDAPDAVLRLFIDPSRRRKELHALANWLERKGVTTLMTIKENPAPYDRQAHDFIEYLADCVIHLDQRVVEQITTRRLRVVKYRGSPYYHNEFPFSITRNGIWIIPVTQTSLQHHGFGETLSSGIPGLDDLICGGYRRNSCTLFAGTSGTGKTTFACSFAAAAVERGERVLYLDFEESLDALSSSLVSVGIDWNRAMDSNALHFVSSMPESKGVEEHLIDAFREIEEFQPEHLVVDAISACRRMGSARAAFDYLLRLIDHCKQIGITSLLTNLADSADPREEITGIDLSSVIDTVILLRNAEAGGSYTRELAILKSRGRAHSNRVHVFRITDNGILIDNPAPTKSLP